MSLIVTGAGYNFVQSTPSTTWTIDHNLGHHPIVAVHITINGQVTTILPLNIQNVSLTQTIVTFSEAHSGTARCV